jgi:MOSC domain-containing protein YiiM
MMPKPSSPVAGRLVAVSVSDAKGVAKHNVPEVTILPDWGVQGDAHAGPWHRQVSLLALESIEKMRREGLAVQPGDFAENLTTEGIGLFTLPVGTRLAVGDQVLLEVSQIGKSCHKGCAIFQQVGKCIMPLEGIFARVLRGGVARPGDAIRVAEDALP